MNPFKFGQLMKHLTRAKQQKPDLPEVALLLNKTSPEVHIPDMKPGFLADDLLLKYINIKNNNSPSKKAS